MKMIGAFFDMDHTLIRCNSGARWMKFMRKRGELSLLGLIEATTWLMRYKLSILDMETDDTLVKFGAGVEIDHVEHGVAGPDDVERRIEDVGGDGHARFLDWYVRVGL